MADEPESPGRRRVLLGLAGVAGLAAVGGAAFAVAPDRIKDRVGLGPDPFVPDDPEGRITLERVRSEARQQSVELFTAAPAGHGDGVGLPVVVVLHGASATPADFRGFGFGRFLTRAVGEGAAPFVLAGASGGRLQWQPDPASDDDPHRMLVDELPRWLEERGFDAERRAVWGWSMGGYGALRLAETDAGWMRATAAFSPAITTGDAVSDNVDRLDGSRLGIWCGDDDPFREATGQLVDRCRPEPAVVSFSPGGHTRAYWNDHTLAASATSRHTSRGDPLRGLGGQRKCALTSGYDELPRSQSLCATVLQAAGERRGGRPGRPHRLAFPFRRGGACG